MHRVKFTVESIKKLLKKYDETKRQDNEVLIEIFRELDTAEYLFSNYLRDILRDYPEISCRRIR